MNAPRLLWHVLTLLGVLSLSACATSTVPATRQTASSDRICTTEKPLGTQIPRTVCRSRAQVEAEQEAAATTLRDQIRNTVSSPGEQQ